MASEEFFRVFFSSDRSDKVNKLKKTDLKMPLHIAPDRWRGLKTCIQAIYDSLGEACHECGRSMTASNHYQAYLCCTKCRYSTCCSKSMAKHHDLFHSERKIYPISKRRYSIFNYFCSKTIQSWQTNYNEGFDVLCLWLHCSQWQQNGWALR